MALDTHNDEIRALQEKIKGLERIIQQPVPCKSCSIAKAALFSVVPQNCCSPTAQAGIVFHLRTAMEERFTKGQIADMIEQAGKRVVPCGENNNKEV